MARIPIVATLLAGLLLGSLSGCSSETTSVRSAVPTSAPAPSSTWLAVLASAADPNDLDAARRDAVRGLGAQDVAHVVVSPGACFTGIPELYGPLYVLGVTDDSRATLIDRLGASAADAGWIGAVTATCLD
jgi:hypothetical protein